MGFCGSIFFVFPWTSEWLANSKILERKWKEKRRKKLLKEMCQCSYFASNVFPFLLLKFWWLFNFVKKSLETWSRKEIGYILRYGIFRLRQYVKHLASSARFLWVLNTSLKKTVQRRECLVFLLEEFDNFEGKRFEFFFWIRW